MKECRYCNNLALYDDSQMNCPRCGRPLTTITLEDRVEPIVEPDITIDPEPVYTTRETRPATPLRNEGVFRSEYHGTISNTNYYTQVHHTLGKIFRLLFLGEPFQWGVLSQYADITVEELTDDGLPVDQQSFVFYGDLHGRLAYGQEVYIQTGLNRHNILRIYDQNHRLIAGRSTILRLIILVLFVLFIVNLPSILKAILNGAILAGSSLLNILLALFISLLPALIMIYGIYIMIRGMFR